MKKPSVTWVKHEGMYPKPTADEDDDDKVLKRWARQEDKLRINRFKARKERKLKCVSKKIVKGVRWNDAVSTLTGALSEAIWREGGAHVDAVATAEIVYHAILRDLDSLFGKGKVVPFKRNKDYFRKEAR